MELIEIETAGQGTALVVATVPVKAVGTGGTGVVDEAGDSLAG